MELTDENIYTSFHNSLGRLRWSRACCEFAENSMSEKAVGHPALVQAVPKWSIKWIWHLQEFAVPSPQSKKICSMNLMTGWSCVWSWKLKRHMSSRTKGETWGPALHEACGGLKDSSVTKKGICVCVCVWDWNPKVPQERKNASTSVESLTTVMWYINTWKGIGKSKESLV